MLGRGPPPLSSLDIETPSYVSYLISSPLTDSTSAASELHASTSDGYFYIEGCSGDPKFMVYQAVVISKAATFAAHQDVIEDVSSGRGADHGCVPMFKDPTAAGHVESMIRKSDFMPPGGMLSETERSRQCPQPSLSALGKTWPASTTLPGAIHG